MAKIPYPVASGKYPAVSRPTVNSPAVSFRQFLKHPVLIFRGVILAHRLGCRFNGIWADGALEFHDYRTGSGFTLPTGAQTIWHARGKLLELRRSFYPTENDKICDGSLVTPSPTQRSRHV